jgi:hypothetical protein
MEKPYLSVSEFYENIKKRKTKSNLIKLREFITNLDNKYNIVSLDESSEIKECPAKYPSSYIVNQSNKRFKNEIANSHFLNHWNELCQYPEIAGQLRLIYNVINMKKDDLVNILDKYNQKTNQTKIFIKSDPEFKEIVKFLGLNNKIDRIKTENLSPITKKNKNKLEINDNIDSASLSIDDTIDKKMLINFSIIINLDNEYPRNLVTCPLEKTILAERIKKNNKSFVCHKHNMIERLKTDKLCLSIWLIKNKKKKGSDYWYTRIKMGTSYLSDTFPAEKGSINNFIRDIINLGYTKESAQYLAKIREAVDEGLFYAVETTDPRIKNILSKNIKLTKKNK